MIREIPAAELEAVKQIVEMARNPELVMDAKLALARLSGRRLVVKEAAYFFGWPEKEVVIQAEALKIGNIRRLMGRKTVYTFPWVCLDAVDHPFLVHGRREAA